MILLNWVAFPMVNRMGDLSALTDSFVKHWNKTVCDFLCILASFLL